MENKNNPGGGKNTTNKIFCFFRKAVSVSAPEVQLFSTPEVGLTGSSSTGSSSIGSSSTVSNPHRKLVQSAD